MKSIWMAMAPTYFPSAWMADGEVFQERSKDVLARIGSKDGVGKSWKMRGSLIKCFSYPLLPRKKEVLVFLEKQRWEDILGSS